MGLRACLSLAESELDSRRAPDVIRGVKKRRQTRGVASSRRAVDGDEVSHYANAMKPEDMWLQLAQNRPVRRPQANLDLHIASNCIHDPMDAKNSIGAQRTGRSRDGYDADVRACDKQRRLIIDVLTQTFDPHAIAF